MSEQELRPCPFCGGAAEQRNSDAPRGGMVNCRSCGAEAFGPKWNRRVPAEAELETAQDDAANMRLLSKAHAGALQRLQAREAELVEALEWYADEAEAAQRNMAKGKSPETLLAILTVFANDGGRRARAALSRARSAGDAE